MSDLKRSLSFYKDVIGFKEKNGFEVAGSFPEKVGLTDGTPLKIHVLVLGDGENATNLKLMQVSSKKKSKSNRATFHSHPYRFFLHHCFC